MTCIIFFGLRLKERGEKEETFSRRALADRARADATAGLKHRVQISLKTKQILFYNTNTEGQFILTIYIIKELVLKQCSKFYASRGNIAK